MSTFNRNVPHLIRRCAQAAFCFALLLQTAVAQPCASLPSRAQLKTMDVNRLGAVALQGWLTCGWAAAEPVMRRWRVAAHAAWLQEQRAEGAFFDKHEQLRDNAFAMGLALLVFVNPSEIDSVLEDYFEEIDREERSTAAATWQMDADVETRLRHFEAGLPQAIALLRRDVSRSPGAALELDLALVKYEVRQDRIDAARALLDRAEAVWRAREQDWSVKASHQLRIDELRKVLAPVVLQPSVPGNRGWTLDRRRDRGCGTGVFKERRYGVNYLRAYVLRTADTHLVMVERLDARWVGEVYGDSRSSPACCVSTAAIPNCARIGTTRWPRFAMTTKSSASRFKGVSCRCRSASSNPAKPREACETGASRHPNSSRSFVPRRYTASGIRQTERGDARRLCLMRRTDVWGRPPPIAGA
jgi:hypothetical protein